MYWIVYELVLHKVCIQNSDFSYVYISKYIYIYVCI